jgi:hypothetical protein
MSTRGEELMAEKGFGPLQADSTPARWFDAVGAGIVRTWRERTTARQISRESLRIYREVEESFPELIGLRRYHEIIARQTGLDDSGVREILERAEGSFASWPVERPLKFRDVVQYIVAIQCLKADTTVLGVRSRLTTIIAEEIPGEL